ncbi:MAG: transcriptional repressor [Bacteroidota bacterium]
MQTVVMEEEEKDFRIVIDVFTKFLEERGLKKTNERFQILEEIYNREHRFDVDDLYFQMKAKNYTISKATIYNNLQLLIDGKLLRKHHFGHKKSVYEKCYFSERQDQIILRDNGKILDFRDDRVEDIKKSLEKKFKIKITNHSLYFYGYSTDKQPK